MRRPKRRSLFSGARRWCSGLGPGRGCPCRGGGGAPVAVAVLAREGSDQAVHSVVAHFVGKRRAVGAYQADAFDAQVVYLPAGGGLLHLGFEGDRLLARPLYLRAPRDLAIPTPDPHPTDPPPALARVR